MTAAKPLTRQMHQRSVNRALDYLRDHLGAPLSLHDLAEQAALSLHHFHRVFTRLTGEPPARTLVRSRLEKAAFLLRHLSLPLRQIGSMASYRSVSALTKAFTRQFGVSPAAYRRRAKTSSNLPPLAAEVASEVRIRAMLRGVRRGQRPTRRVLYARGSGFVEGHFNAQAQQLWPALCAQALGLPLPVAGTEYLASFPHCTNITDAAQCYYEACITVPASLRLPPSDYCTQYLPGGRFAVFEHVGPYTTLHESWRAIHQQWLPTSGERLRPAPSYELHRAGHTPPNSDGGVIELYVPIQ